MDKTNTQYGYTGYKNNLTSTIKFELKSLVGRLFSPKIRKNKFSLVNLGCGNMILDEFENIDFYTMRFWKAKSVGHDFRYKLPYKDNVFEGAFCDNMLEHLHPSDGKNFLKEVHRILKSGSVFRVIVPDLKRYIDYYNGKNLNGFDIFDNGCNAIWNLTHNWGHLAVFDTNMLSLELEKAGFNNISQKKYREGDDKRLLKDREGRGWECLFVECTA
jgi:SAM-dependent methyltransferase